MGKGGGKSGGGGAKGGKGGAKGGAKGGDDSGVTAGGEKDEDHHASSRPIPVNRFILSPTVEKGPTLSPRVLDKMEQRISLDTPIKNEVGPEKAQLFSK